MATYVDFLLSLTNLATILAAGFTAYCAWKGLSIWREETLGKRKIELVEEALSSVYVLKSELRKIRSGWGLSDSDVKDINNGYDKKLLKNFYAPIFRMERSSEIINRAMSCQYKLKVYFGDDVSKIYDKLDKLLWRINVSAKMLLDHSNDWKSAGFQITDLKQWKEDIWYTGENDKLEKEFSDLIVRLERVVKSSGSR